MMKRVAMLLNGPIKNDYRVIKMIETLSRVHLVDLYYIKGNPIEDANIFNKNVRLFATNHQEGIWNKLIRHTWFCYEFSFFQKMVLNTQTNYDSIWANDLPTLYPAFKISRALKAKLIFDSHEIYTETINQFFPRKSSGLKHFIFERMISFMRWHGKRIEKKIIPKTDTFISVNESIVAFFKERYPIKRGIVIMNLPRKSQSAENPTIDLKKQFLWNTDDHLILYQGQLNEGRGLSLLMESMELLPDEYKLVIIGNGSIQHQLIQWVNQKSLTNRIKFIDTIALRELPSYTAGADLGINLLENFNLSKAMASPNKLFEYIHAGIPVVASDTMENKRVFDQFNIGQLTSNTPESISASIIQVVKQDKSSFHEALQKAKTQYHWENQEDLLNSIIEA